MARSVRHCCLTVYPRLFLVMTVSRCCIGFLLSNGPVGLFVMRSERYQGPTAVDQANTFRIRVSAPHQCKKRVIRTLPCWCQRDEEGSICLLDKVRRAQIFEDWGVRSLDSSCGQVVPSSSHKINCFRIGNTYLMKRGLPAGRSRHLRDAVEWHRVGANEKEGETACSSRHGLFVCKFGMW